MLNRESPSIRRISTAPAATVAVDTGALDTGAVDTGAAVSADIGEYYGVNAWHLGIEGPAQSDVLVHGSFVAQRSVHSPSQRGDSELEACDCFVLYSELDDASQQICALDEWALKFAAAHDRPPMVWWECLCVDDTLAKHELLAHIPIYLAGSARLLLILGPAFASCQYGVSILWCWRALGRRSDEIDVVLAVRSPAEARDTVASFDAFHVNAFSSTENVSPAVGSSTRAVPKTRSPQAEAVLWRVFAIAGESRINRCVRQITPKVAAAAAALQRQSKCDPESARGHAATPLGLPPTRLPPTSAPSAVPVGHSPPPPDVQLPVSPLPPEPPDAFGASSSLSNRPGRGTPTPGNFKRVGSGGRQLPPRGESVVVL